MESGSGALAFARKVTDAAEIFPGELSLGGITVMCCTCGETASAVKCRVMSKREGDLALQQVQL